MRITLDTNFLISATQWDYSIAHKLLMKLISADAEIFTTKDILDEFAEVLRREFKYDKDELDDIREKLLSFLKLIEPLQRVEIVKDDSDDNKIIECAIESKSLYIITYDKHLLNLIEYNYIKIVRPEELIDLL